jgi:hypothetical protein
MARYAGLTILINKGKNLTFCRSSLSNRYAAHWIKTREENQLWQKMKPGQRQREEFQRIGIWQRM